MDMHAIWKSARGPFRHVTCVKHTWERFDCQMAGCILCGAKHECASVFAESVCPLEKQDDGAVCCTITGFSLPIVRYSKDEYVEHAVRLEGKCHVASAVESLSDSVSCIVNWFLVGSTSVECKKDEISRTLSRFHLLVVKELKVHKMKTAGDGVLSLPCLPDIIAQTIHQVHPKHCSRASQSLCQFCSQHITKCIINLDLVSSHTKRVSLVVGLLYLMKQGLTIQNVQWLPRVPSLAECLPHEACLEKTFKLSMKLVCETENEVKLALRHRVKLL